MLFYVLIVCLCLFTLCLLVVCLLFAVWVVCLVFDVMFGLAIWFRGLVLFGF